MLAARLTEIKSPLVVEDIPNPAADAHSVVVELKAGALNRRDYWITQGLYPGIQLPVVLGSDGAGTIAAIGDSVDSAWLGQEVVINPALDWGESQTHQLPNFHILGMPHDGTLAERVVVPVSQVHAKPGHLDWHQAAALPLAGLTAYRALFSQGQVQSGQKVLVTGIGGGVATFALQFAVAAGAIVTVTSSSADKLDRAGSLGATHTFNYQEPDWSKHARQECGGFDLIIDGAGGNQYGKLMTLAEPGGCIVNYGSTAGAADSFDLFKLFWKQLRLVGSSMGSPTDFLMMLEMVNEHQITPAIDEVLPLQQANQAIDRMGRCEQFGKIVLAIS